MSGLAGPGMRGRNGGMEIHEPQAAGTGESSSRGNPRPRSQECVMPHPALHGTGREPHVSMQRLRTFQPAP